MFELYSCSPKKIKDNSSAYLDTQSKPVIENFFQEIQTGKFKIALKDLLRRNENFDFGDSSIISLQKKFEDINEYSGKFLSVRLLRQKQIGNDLGVYCYLVKYEKKFYRFLFTFYNNGIQTKIYKFSFDDTIDTELEEAIRLYVN